MQTALIQQRNNSIEAIVLVDRSRSISFYPVALISQELQEKSASLVTSWQASDTLLPVC
jgi:hypothetical protein